jgi:hypothetical protein
MIPDDLIKTEGGGLLSAALLRKKHDYFHAAETSFKASVSTTPSTLDAPASLFSRFVDSYRIKKGALLLPDSDPSCFIHVSSVGLDITTIRRLRIPVKDIATEETALFSENDLALFRPYFSVREFAVLEKLLLIPGFHNNRLAAILIVTEGLEFIFSDPPAFPDYFLKAILDSSPALIKKNSEEPLHTITIEDADLLLSSLLEKHGTVSSAFVDCSGIIDFLVKKHPDADPYVILHRGITFTARQLKNGYPHSEVVHLTEGNMLFLIPAIPYSRAGSLFHQTTITLRSRFGTSGEIPSVPFRTALSPDDGISLSELFPDISLPHE